jgi:PAS domain-containing protein
MTLDLPISRDTLDAEPWPACVLDRSGDIVRVNDAWDRVAAETQGPLGAEVLGTRWSAYIRGEELRAWYEAVLDRVLTRGVGESHRCDCNTPDRFRLFSSRFEPLRKHRSTERVGVLVLTSMLEEAPIGERYKIGPLDERRYLTPDGLVFQCSGCRRVRVAGPPPSVWELVPEYVAKPRQDVSHGLCRLCRELYYGMIAREGS